MRSDIIVGFYSIQNNNLHVWAQLLDVNALRLSPPLTQDGPLDHMLDVLDSARMARRPYPRSEVSSAGSQTFMQLASICTWNGFENYVRGIIEARTGRAHPPSQVSRSASKTPPTHPAWLALGMTYFSEQVVRCLGRRTRSPALETDPGGARSGVLPRPSLLLHWPLRRGRSCLCFRRPVSFRCRRW